LKTNSSIQKYKRPKPNLTRCTREKKLPIFFCLVFGFHSFPFLLHSTIQGKQYPQPSCAWLTCLTVLYQSSPHCHVATCWGMCCLYPMCISNLSRKTTRMCQLVNFLNDIRSLIFFSDLLQPNNTHSLLPSLINPLFTFLILDRWIRSLFCWATMCSNYYAWLALL